MKRLINWMFSCPASPERPLRNIWWWEVRRIPFNIIMGSWGFLCLVAVYWGTSVHLVHGEDAVEPIAVLAAPIVINVLYTLGWLLEVPVRLARPRTSPRFGPALLMLGLGAGMVLSFLPAAFWVGYRLLH